ncbi:hypothetical protein BESB_005160 [Besnoitia besnoiti]|uniref:Transmembrane protein n=1 Tax=Besnoitia besnoiti TaxID=94643 RepID=A0A2A9MJM9_BESBE|nr:hypothetical protein BESB_005160 [Besnoitia besnoiti]PFH38175.1 hypothetical protein BESB_005160 [Besnoitia besnoiti]
MTAAGFAGRVVRTCPSRLDASCLSSFPPSFSISLRTHLAPSSLFCSFLRFVSSSVFVASSSHVPRHASYLVKLPVFSSRCLSGGAVAPHSLSSSSFLGGSLLASASFSSRVSSLSASPSFAQLSVASSASARRGLASPLAPPLPASHPPFTRSFAVRMRKHREEQKLPSAPSSRSLANRDAPPPASTSGQGQGAYNQSFPAGGEGLSLGWQLFIAFLSSIFFYAGFVLVMRMFGGPRVVAVHVDQHGRPVDPSTGRPL